MLYILATPIGNLGDISQRAKEVLENADLILAEDTRSAFKLLNHLEISNKKVESFFEHNERERTPKIINYLKDITQHSKEPEVVLISESGTPLISDPGFKLVRECHMEQIKVVPIPGPSAITASLSACGMPTDKFMFLGFLPREKGKRKKLLLNSFEVKKTIKHTVVVYESPYRILSTLLEIKEIFGEIEVCVCRELTKKFEEISLKPIDYFIEKYKTSPPKGEITLVF